MFRFLIPLLIALFVFPVVALSPAPPALEPVNWEADADPRFEPRVEQVIVDRAQHRAKQDDATDATLWAGWGLEAMVPLRAVLEDPKWEDPFKSRALDLMYACSLEGADGTLAEELGRRAANVTKDNNKSIQVYGTHLYAAVNRHPDLLETLLTHENAEVRYLAAQVLASRLQKITPEIAPLIDAYSASEDPAVRQNAINLLLSAPTKDNNARALEIAATISEDAVKGVRQRLESNAPRERAMEPMRLILEKEGK